MSYSKSIAVRFAMELNSVALGIWEATRLMQDAKTKEEGQRKLHRLRGRLGEFKKQPVLSDSLNIFLKEEFRPEDYQSLLDRLEQGNLKDVIPAVQELAQRTHGYLNESRREKTDFRRAL